MTVGDRGPTRRHWHLVRRYVFREPLLAVECIPGRIVVCVQITVAAVAEVAVQWVQCPYERPRQSGTSRLRFGRLRSHDTVFVDVQVIVAAVQMTRRADV
jgi:hypothetical protein